MEDKAPISFYKYEGTGNDFIILDNRDLKIGISDKKLVTKLCQRRKGIGADGLILIQDHKTYDFEIIYFNADSTSSFCGNGSMCAAHFAKYLGIINEESNFLSNSGVCKAIIKEDEVRLKVDDISHFSKIGEFIFINTGSPHLVKFIPEDLDRLDLKQEVSNIIKSGILRGETTNFTFYSFDHKEKDKIYARTYERGVEGETLSCGTGAIASALGYNVLFNKSNKIVVDMKGGILKVEFEIRSNSEFINVFLTGKVKMVYKGTVDLGFRLSDS